MSFEQTRQIVEERLFNVDKVTQAGFEITFSTNETASGSGFNAFTINFNDASDRFYAAQTLNNNAVQFFKGFQTGIGWQGTGSSFNFVCNPRTSSVTDMVANIVTAFNNKDLADQNNPPDDVRTDELFYEAIVKSSDPTTIQFFKKEFTEDVTATPTIAANPTWEGNSIRLAGREEPSIDPDARSHPYSTTSKEGLDRVVSMSSNGRIVTAAANANGIFEEVDRYTIFRDGQTFTQPPNDPFIVLFINDADNRVTSFAGDLNKTGGVIRFRINVPRSLSNPVRIARLIADAINIRIGFSGGSSTTDTNRYPTGNVGGTLYNDRGILNRISDDDAGYLVYTLDFLYTYYN